MNVIIEQEIANMSIKEKICLVEDLWDTIAASKDEITLTPTQKKELDHRLENYDTNPESAVSWEIMKTKLNKKK